MMTCPKCDRYLLTTIKFNGTNSGYRIWSCPCGYSREYDASGLNYSNIVDRYKFIMINEVNKK